MRLALYFNRRADAPLVWCIAPLLPGDVIDEAKEEKVAAFIFLGNVMRESRYRPIPQRDDHEGPPAAYFIAEGTYSIAQETGLCILAASP